MRFSFRAIAAISLLLVVLAITPGSAAATSFARPPCVAGPALRGDTIVGTPCADTIVVPPGVERVKGGAGNDTIRAASADAVCPSGCQLGVGSQTFEGGPGDDIVYGQRGNDTLKGGEGDDQLFGGIGDDLLLGGPGDDRLSGGFGADSIDGEAGDDYVRGDGTIDDIRDTGGGTDTLSYSTGVTPGFGGAVPGFPGFPGASGERGVRLELGAAGENADDGIAASGGGVDEVEGQSFERVIGTPYSDYIVGTSAGQAIYGGGGADVILGEGGSDTLDGGADGDYVDGGSVVGRDQSKVSVGFMAPGQPGPGQLYLTGSNAKDMVSAVYAPTAVTFTLAAGSFDQSAAAGCAVGPTQATCPLAAPLDSIVIAGMGGDDTISAGGFPISTAVVITGGAGTDSLSGGDASEDVLVDDPPTPPFGNDELNALGGDDALLHNGGADRLLGGAGNDLFLSVSICDGEALVGGEGRDNASWARLKGQGVEARIDPGDAGRPGPAGAPECAGGSFDSMQEMEDLEGSGAADVLIGGPGENQLLGHPGPDVYLAGAGDDSILANSGDADPVIDCGDDLDSAIVDHPQYGDAAPVNCESVREADPDSFQTTTELPPPFPPAQATPPASSPAPPRDVKPPRTKILTHPAALLIIAKARRRVVFRFSSNEAGSTFRCRLDRRRPAPCRSPRAYSLSLGRHTIRIAAIDAAGNVDRTPAHFVVRVRHRRGLQLGG